MDFDELKRLVREHYPFPIAHAHTKTLGVLDDNRKSSNAFWKPGRSRSSF